MKTAYLITLATGVFATAGAKNIKLLGSKHLHHLRHSDATTTKALLQKATPYQHSKRSHRQLEGANDQQNNQAYQVDGSYSISFGKCIDIKTKSENLFNNENYDYIDQEVQNGNVLSLKSYVTFYACQKKDDSSYGCLEDESDVYMVDLSSYLSVVGMSQVNQRSDYCELCEQNQEYCAANVYEQAAAAYGAGNDGADDDEEEDDDFDEDDDEEEEDDDFDEDEDDEDDDEEQWEEEDQAEEAEEVQDYNDEDDDLDYDDDDVDVDYDEEDDDFDSSYDESDDEQVQEDGGARKLEQQFDCSRCDELQCFAKDADDDAVAAQAADRDEIDTYVAAWIEEVVNCKQTDAVINDMPIYIGPICSDYADTFEIGTFLDEDCTVLTNFATFDSIVAAEQKGDESVDVARYAINSLKSASYGTMTCQSPDFEGDAEEEDGEEMNDYCKQLFESDLVSFNDCAAEEEEAQQQDEEADDEYSWYSYDMEDADEIGDVCAKIASFNGEFSNYYDSAASGSVHSRYRNGKLVTEESTSSIFSAGAITAIVLACTVVIGAAVHVLRPKIEKVDGSALHEAMYQGGQMS